MVRFRRAAVVLLLLLGLAVLSVGAYHFLVYACRPTPVEAMRYVVHGGGQLDGHNLYGEEKLFPCSNSAEGLAQCAEAGVTAVELDFSFTSDGRLVCLHDWYHMYADEIETGVALSYDAFREAKIFREFASIGIEEVVQFMRENRKVYVVTDVKDDNLRAMEIIHELCPTLKDRFIVQIYSEDEYDAVRALGFENIVYSLYRLTWEEKTDVAALGEFAKTHPLVGFTFSTELCEVDGYVDGMLSLGTPLFVHTVNGEEEQLHYFDLGFSGVYTDEVKR